MREREAGRHREGEGGRWSERGRESESDNGEQEGALIWLYFYRVYATFVRAGMHACPHIHSLIYYTHFVTLCFVMLLL